MNVQKYGNGSKDDPNDHQIDDGIPSGGVDSVENYVNNDELDKIAKDSLMDGHMDGPNDTYSKVDIFATNNFRGGGNSGGLDMDENKNDELDKLSHEDGADDDPKDSLNDRHITAGGDSDDSDDIDDSDDSDDSDGKIDSGDQ